MPSIVAHREGTPSLRGESFPGVYPTFNQGEINRQMHQKGHATKQQSRTIGFLKQGLPL